MLIGSPCQKQFRTRKLQLTQLIHDAYVSRKTRDNTKRTVDPLTLKEIRLFQRLIPSPQSLSSQTNPW